MKVVAHPPERRRRGITLAAHGCCCCCCCCLHSIGGLIGAGVAGAKVSTPLGRRTVGIYWLLLLGTIVLGFTGMALKEGAGAAFLYLILLLPLAQLNASLLVLLLGIFTPLDLRALGLITWKSFFWGVIGALIMIVPFMISQYS